MQQTDQNQVRDVAPGTQRDTNFELLRIFSMLLIIAQHYVVNSNLTDSFDLTHLSFNMVFLQIQGSGGFIAVNCFTLLTGYFMVGSKWRFTKFLRLVLEIWFYRIVLNLVMYVCGYGEFFSIRYLIRTAFSFVFNVNEGYVSSMLCMYLLIPFMNQLIRVMTRKQFFLLLCLLVFVYSIIPTFLLRETFHYVIWLCVVYLVGAYIRLYPSRLTQSSRFAAGGLLASASLMVASILVIDGLAQRTQFFEYDVMSSQVNKFLIFVEAVSLFVLFKNMKIKNSRLINRIAASTFGVVLIHGNNEALRQFLWVDLFQNTKFYDSPLLVLHMAGAIFAVYIVCTLIDMARIRFVEKPLFRRLDQNATRIDLWIENKIDRLIRHF